LEHFRTQLPYALFNGIISIIAFLIAGLTGASLIIIGALLVQVALLILLAKKAKINATDLRG